jgi:multiple sugar transport system substrate-binding protein
LLADYPDNPKLRYLKAMGQSYDLVTARPRMKEWFQVEDILGLHLNRAVIGEETAKEALDTAAAEILELMQKAGYQIGIKGQ